MNQRAASIRLLRATQCVALALALLCLQGAVPAQGQADADPNCETGVRARAASLSRACCPAACGECGGATCFARGQELGTRCCPSGILRASNGVPSCASGPPPCVLEETERASPPADPDCSTGVASGGACCRSECGTCGGAGCFQRTRETGTRCCRDGILDVQNGVPLCSEAGPPCRLESPGVSSPTSAEQAAPSGFSPTKGKWQTARVVSGSLSKRHEACAVMVNGLVVLLGGRGIKPVDVYDPRTGRWSRRNGPPGNASLHHMQCVVVGASVWIVSSWRGGYPNEDTNELVYEYNVAADQWKTYPGMAAARRRGAAASVRRGSLIYVVAGNIGGHGAQATSLTWVDAFNVNTKRWTTSPIPNMPGPGRDHVGGALVKGQLCIAGGRDGGVANFFKANIASVYCYSFSAGAWQRKADIPQVRAGANTGTACDGRMVLAGGEGDGKAYARVDVFDGSKWERGPDLVRARHSTGLAFANCRTCGHIFIPSGSGGQGGNPELDTTEQFIPTGAGSCMKY